MEVRRGFLMVRDPESGNLVPFFVKVREEDILNYSGQTRNDEITGDSSGWKYVTHSLSTDKRIHLSRRFPLDGLTYVRENNCYVKVSIPFKLSVNDTTILIGKESSGSTVFSQTFVEACLTDVDDSGYSSTLEIRFYDSKSGFTETNINLDTLIVSVEINGYME